MSNNEPIMNAFWMEGDAPSKRHHRQVAMSFEPTPLPESCFSINTGSEHHFEEMSSLVTLFPEFCCSSEPIADHWTDDIFDDYPSRSHVEKMVLESDAKQRETRPGPISVLSRPHKVSNDIDNIDGDTIDGAENPTASRRWQERFTDLVAYKQRFGNCCVPSQWSENPPLAQWVKRQRYQLKLQKEGQHSTMSVERKMALDKLGFTWDPHTAFWEERLEELERFRDENGHSNVPTKYPQNPQLAIWAKVRT